MPKRIIRSITAPFLKRQVTGASLPDWARQTKARSDRALRVGCPARFRQEPPLERLPYRMGDRQVMAGCCPRSTTEAAIEHPQRLSGR